MSSASLIVALASPPTVVTTDGREFVQADARIQGTTPVNVVLRSNVRAAAATALKTHSPDDLLICSGDIVLDEGNNTPIVTTNILCKAYPDQYLNEITIVGNVGGDPRTTESGKSTKRSVAINRPFRNPAGEMEERTHWFQIRGYGNLSDRLTRLDKGSLVEVTGCLEQMTNRDGEPYCELKTRSLRVMRKPRKGPSPAEGTGATGYAQSDFLGSDDLDSGDWVN